MIDWVNDIATLEALYGTPGEASMVKVADRLTPEYQTWIEASSFCALATIGPEGLDCSPRGDDGPVVTALDEHTLAMPGRRGNNRIDSLRNILGDPRVSLMFLVPGSGTVTQIAEIYFQCARAVIRGKLWDGGIADAADLPTPGAILEAMTQARIGGQSYDAEWPERAARTMW